MNEILTTFQLVHDNAIISPVLTTIREYGNWFESVFDKYTAQAELYMKSKKKTGESVLEKHPGTRIGYWFDTHDLNSAEYKSWYIMQDSEAMKRLVKAKLAEMKDAIPISVNDDEGRRMIRVYTVEQIQLYVRTLFDKSFNISGYIGTPKQIKVTDLSSLIMPKVPTARKKLF